MLYEGGSQSLVVPQIKSVCETIVCDNSNENYLADLSAEEVYFLDIKFFTHMGSWATTSERPFYNI